MAPRRAPCASFSLQCKKVSCAGSDSLDGYLTPVQCAPRAHRVACPVLHRRSGTSGDCNRDDDPAFFCERRRAPPAADRAFHGGAGDPGRGRGAEGAGGAQAHPRRAAAAARLGRSRIRGGEHRDDGQAHAALGVHPRQLRHAGHARVRRRHRQDARPGRYQCPLRHADRSGRPILLRRREHLDEGQPRHSPGYPDDLRYAEAEDRRRSPLSRAADRGRAQAELHPQRRRQAGLRVQHAAVVLGQRGRFGEAQVRPHGGAARLRQPVPDARQRLRGALRGRVAGDGVTGRGQAQGQPQPALLLGLAGSDLRQWRGRQGDVGRDLPDLYRAGPPGEAGRDAADDGRPGRSRKRPAYGPAAPRRWT